MIDDYFFKSSLMWLSSTVGNMAAMEATACSSLVIPVWLNESTSKMSA